MDPSYNNGNGGIPGAKPGVIASGPDTPPVVEVPSNTTAGLSLGSRHLFKKPRAGTPNRNMVMNVGGTAAGAESRGPRRGVIIAGLVVVVILIVALVAGVMLTQNRGGGNNTQTTMGDDADFYRYANYMLDGSENVNGDLVEKNSFNNYAVVKAFYEYNTTYFDEFYNLWQKFYERIKNNENVSEVSKLRGSIDYQNELMDFVVGYAKAKEYGEEELFKLFINNGLESTNTAIDKKYAELAETTYNSGKEYADALIKSQKTLVGIFARYNSLGCINRDEIDEACVNNHRNELEASLRQYDEEYGNVDSNIPNNAIENLVDNCFMIKSNLENSESDEQNLNSSTNPEDSE